VKQPCVYILASARNGTLYTGVTSDLVRRVWEHKNNLVQGFTRRYALHTLVWFEVHDDMLAAITREKAIKGWKRRWKLEVIEAMNPSWRDLYPDLLRPASSAGGKERSLRRKNVTPDGDRRAVTQRL
jgi:putative endonuclease